MTSSGGWPRKRSFKMNIATYRPTERRPISAVLPFFGTALAFVSLLSLGAAAMGTAMMVVM
jgi:hypothetical protein